MNNNNLNYKLAITNYCNELREAYGFVSKILFIQIPQFNISTVNRQVVKNKGYYAFPPTGLQFLFESITDNDIHIEILDANYQLLKKLCEDKDFQPDEWLRIVRAKIDEFEPDLIGIGCMFDVGINFLVNLLKMIQSQDNCIVISGGVIPSFEWEWLLGKELCHFVVRGEGEDKINILLNHLNAQNKDMPDTVGICFRYNGHIYGSDAMPSNVEVRGNLNNSYSHIDLENYHKYGSLNPFSRMAGVDDRPFAPLQFSRGCRGQCTFCAVRGIMGNGVRARQVDDVIDEMQYLIDERGVRHFEWLDDDLLFHRHQFKELMKRIVQKGWKISWSAGNGLVAQSIDREMLKLFKGSGCLGFRIGIESGNDDMLKKIRKPGTKKGFRRVAELVKDFPEIFVGGNFIIGLQHETFGQMLDSFQFALELNFDWAAITVCQPVRGASAFSDFSDYFLEQLDSGGKETHNLIPTRDTRSGRIEGKDGLKRAWDIFNINRNEIPSDEQVKEIWFTFNLIANYIYNKNLMNPESVRKFILWVEMAQRAHPPSGYMSLFLALGYVLAGNEKKARHFLDIVKALRQEGYWQYRFESFDLNHIIDTFPDNATQALSTIESMRDSCQKYLPGK